MWFSKKRPGLDLVPVTDEENRLIEAAESELPRIPERNVPKDDNMPFNVLFPRLRNRMNDGFKPISKDGTLIGRAVDDANVALEQNKIAEMRRSRD